MSAIAHSASPSVTKEWIEAKVAERVAFMNARRKPGTRPYEVRYYQVEAWHAMLTAYLERGVVKQMLVLPTGCGKTFTFAMLSWLIEQIQGRCKALVIAHRVELCTQALGAFKAVRPEMRQGILCGDEPPAYNRDVIAAMVQTIGRENKFDPRGWSDKLIRLLANGPWDLVVVDESHHSAAPSYVRVLEALNQIDSLRLGVTATPNRADGQELATVYDEIVYSYSIVQAISDEYLTPPRGVRVHLDIDLDDVKVAKSKGGGEKDFRESQLAQKFNTEEVRAKTIEAWLQFGKDRKTIAFCCTVDHAVELAADLRSRGIAASAITGSTSPEEREGMYKRLAEGRIQVLISVMVLTEGFDEPSVDCVLLVRPTQSWALFVQMVGRGLRLYDNKPDCLILDLTGNTQKYSLQGLNMLGGFDIEEVAEAEEEDEEASDGEASDGDLDEPGDADDPSPEPRQRPLFVQVGKGEDVDLVQLKRPGKYSWNETEFGHALVLGAVDTGGMFLIRPHNPDKENLPQYTAKLYKIVHMKRRTELASAYDKQGGYEARVVAEQRPWEEALALCEQDAPRLGAKRGPQGVDESGICGATLEQVQTAVFDVTWRDKQLNRGLKKPIRGAAMKPSAKQMGALVRELGLSPTLIDDPRMTKAEAQRLIARGHASGWQTVQVPAWMREAADAQAAG